jgi:uncharacterized protein (DUF4415 family)
MKANVTKTERRRKPLLTRTELKTLRAEEKAAGVPDEFRFPKRYKIIPKDQRRQYPPEAFEDRNTKVRITMYLDLDVLNHFKARAEKDGIPYQRQINAELRSLIEREQGNGGPTAQLREAKGLIDAALRQL